MTLLRFSKWMYYLSSIFTLLTRIHNPFKTILLFLGFPIREVRLYNGCRLKVRSAMDVWVIKETCLDRDYERVSGIEIENGWTVIDIGAGLGDFAVNVAYEKPDATIYAFEPFPESFALLNDNMRLNNIHNVQAFPYAVNSKAQKAHLNIETATAVMHSTQLQGDSAAQVEVDGISLDQFFVQHNITQCDFMKIDCEGCEYDILQSFESLAKVRHICLEYHDWFPDVSHVTLTKHLEAHDFEVMSVGNPVHDTTGFVYARNLRP